MEGEVLAYGDEGGDEEAECVVLPVRRPCLAEGEGHALGRLRRDLNGHVRAPHAHTHTQRRRLHVVEPQRRNVQHLVWE